MEEDEVRAKLKSEELSYETMATVLATAKVDKEQTKAMEGLVRVLNQLENTLDKERIAGIEGIMTDNGLGLTRSQIEAINNAGVENYFSDITNDQLVAMEYVKDDGTADRERFEQDMLFRLGNAKAALENAEATVGKYVANDLGKDLLLQIGSIASSGGVELSIEQE
jgi:hypothetical protein